MGISTVKKEEEKEEEEDESTPRAKINVQDNIDTA